VKYRKKPVEIEAVQWTGENFVEITDWAGDVWGRSGKLLVIHTLEGTMSAQPGDWIIRGVQGEFYPCKPDIFDQTYEPVE
jgi:hypothetical protein